MAEPISDEHVALLRGKHGPTGPETSHGSLNVGIAPPCKCGYVWPCTVARLLARLEAAEALAVPEGWKVEWLAESPIGPVNVPRLVSADTEKT